MAPLSRMTYCAYLIHMQLMQVFHFSRKTIMHFDVYFMVRYEKIYDEVE